MSRNFGFARVFALAALSGLAVFGVRIADLALGVRADDATKPAAATTEIAIFAGGCFWCMEHPFDAIPGVQSVTSGYSGGSKANPTYEEVSSGRTGHTEVVRVIYDPKLVSYQKLLHVFWRNIDPLTREGQFCDFGSQYRSGIFYTSAAQKQLADASKAELEKSGRFKRPIVTEITQAGPFYAAEAYHQHYYKTNPVRYNLYRFNCGRDGRLEELWGKEAGGGAK